MKSINYKKAIFWTIVAVMAGVAIMVGYGIYTNQKAEDTFIRVSYSDIGENVFWDKIQRNGDSSNTYPSIVISAPEEMAAFIEEMDKYFFLTGGEDSFQKSVEIYDTSYYESGKSLILAYIAENSGSKRHRVKNIAVKNDLLAIAVETYHPLHVHTADMAGWFMVLEVENDKLQEVSEVVVYQAGTEIPKNYAEDSEYVKEFEVTEPFVRGMIWSSWDKYIRLRLLDTDPLREKYEYIDISLDGTETYVDKRDPFDLLDIVTVFYEGEIVEGNPANDTPASVKGTAVYQDGYGPCGWANPRVTWVEGDDEKFRRNAENKELVCGDNSGNHLPIQKLDTYEEWLNFEEEYAKMLYMIYGETWVVEEYSEMVRKCGPTFFETYSLLLIYASCESGSIDFSVDKVCMAPEKFWVEMHSETPEAGTADKAAWLFMTAIEKKELSDDMTFDVIINEIEEPKIQMEKIKASTEIYSLGVPYVDNKRIICRYDTVEELVNFDMYGTLQNCLIKYNEAFFEENSLFLVFFKTNDMGKVYEVNGAYSGGENFEIEILQEDYRIGNNNRAEKWVVIIAVKKEDIKNCTKVSVDIMDSCRINEHGEWYDDKIIIY